jgi:hypothetical protein
MTADKDRRARYYQDQTDAATYDGPLVISDPALAKDPMARSSIADPAGEQWNIGLPLRELIT